MNLNGLASVELEQSHQTHPMNLKPFPHWSPPGPFNNSMDVGMHNGSVVGAFEWDAYGYFVGCNKLGRARIVFRFMCCSEW